HSLYLLQPLSPSTPTLFPYTTLFRSAIDYIEEHAGYERYTIPAGTYEFLEDDVETVAAYAVLVGNTDTISEELGYELAKLMVERSEEHTSELQSRFDLVCRLLLEKKN